MKGRPEADSNILGKDSAHETAVKLIFIGTNSIVLRGRPKEGRPTFTASISLHELILRTCFGELGSQPSKLWKDLIDQAHFRSKLVLVNI